ncbi:hypothetical protein EDC01DRAFT_669605 [Geopyxis carbonaria]|nr:hypothetical protein EDC01DRAFT_669605 [Geopyxis carbonaria]
MAAPLKLKFSTLGVFTSTPFLGNPLAIVHVPPCVRLTQTQKQLIAREFNLSETVFLHEPASDTANILSIDIFTRTAELPFAGHPTVGTAVYLLSQASGLGQLADHPMLLTKAGAIPIESTGRSRARVQVPVDFRAHPPLLHPTARSGQKRLAGDDWVRPDADAVVSVVKGMTFVLLQVRDEAALARMAAYAERNTLPAEYLQALGEGAQWAAGFVGVYAFCLPGAEEDGRTVVRTRMFSGVEDPATGSAASALGSYLASETGEEGEKKYRIVQGVEMGRRSVIDVGVTIEDGKVEAVTLEGEAVVVMEGGYVQVPPASL